MGTLRRISDPGRAPWRVFWAFKVSELAIAPRDCIPPHLLTPEADLENPTIFVVVRKVDKHFDGQKKLLRIGPSTLEFHLTTILN